MRVLLSEPAGVLYAGLCSILEGAGYRAERVDVDDLASLRIGDRDRFVVVVTIDDDFTLRDFEAECGHLCGVPLVVLGSRLDADALRRALRPGAVSVVDRLAEPDVVLAALQLAVHQWSVVPTRAIRTAMFAEAGTGGRCSSCRRARRLGANARWRIADSRRRSRGPRQRKRDVSSDVRDLGSVGRRQQGNRSRESR